ncbi:hypothetical protein [Haloarcula montana]|nr:hypothetical protein [Haloarcula sp. GH36]
MRISTIGILLGLGLFVLPLPGTFITGTLVALMGGLARWLGL